MRIIKWLFFFTLSFGLLNMLVVGVLGEKRAINAAPFILPVLILLWITWAITGRKSFGFILGKMFSPLYKRLKRILRSPSVSVPLRQFSQTLLESKDFSESKLPEWKRLIEAEKLSEKKLTRFKAFEFATLVDEFSDDRKLNDKEWATVQAARKFYDYDIQNSRGPISLAQLGDWRARGIVSEGRLVEMDIAALPVKAKPDERLFLLMPAAFVKRKRVTTGVNYSGVTASVRLGGGFRYRIGTIKLQRISEERLIREDVGTFWVTNERCGYHGDRKSWSMPVKKLSDVQAEEGRILEVFKDGRENPILIVPADLDFTCAVLSLVMNEEYEISASKAAI